MATINKRLLYRIGLYTVAGMIAFSLYAKANVPPETDAEYCKRCGMVKIHDQFFKYNVYEHNEMKPIVDMLIKGCSGDEYCEIDRAYQYVLRIPYKESTDNRNPSDVINQNGGDCDEKSFLLATLLLQKKYKCVLVTTKDHGFVAVHVPNETSLKYPYSYLTIAGKKYYFAETTVFQGYIGQDNNVQERDIDGVFDMVSKKEISLDKIEFHVVKS
ncbi:MAG: hypothetical protein Q7T91_09210 [Sulfuricurvum sp.]|nr:hypothetical protein [Sulfuricurvum sp.]